MNKKWLSKFIIECIIGCIIFGIIAVVVYFSTASFQRRIKGIKTNLSGGTERVATVYSNNGDILAIYEGKIDIADDSNYETQLLVDGKVVNVIGGITIIEER